MHCQRKIRVYSDDGIAKDDASFLSLDLDIDDIAVVYAIVLGIFRSHMDGSGYEARFTKCGICTLLSELGIPEVTPAMCHLDYTMSEAGGASVFVREYTLASGGPYCDCGYKKKV